MVKYVVCEYIASAPWRSETFQKHSISVLTLSCWLSKVAKSENNLIPWDYPHSSFSPLINLHFLKTQPLKAYFNSSLGPYLPSLFFKKWNNSLRVKLFWCPWNISYGFVGKELMPYCAIVWDLRQGSLNHAILYTLWSYVRKSLGFTSLKGPITLKD